MDSMTRKISIKITSEIMMLTRPQDPADPDISRKPDREVRFVEIRTLGRGTLFGGLRRKPRPA
jgi:hypothetical protein